MRMGAAWRYLTAEVRRRPNLTVMGETQVRPARVRRHAAVRASACAGRRRRDEIRAREVIVSTRRASIRRCCSCAAASARRASCARTASSVVADRRGVGKHLMEHPGVNFGCFLKRPARLPAELRRQMFAGLRWSSGVEGCPPGDMYVIPSNKAQWHAIGHRLGVIMMWVNRSFSTGEIRLTSADCRRAARDRLQHVLGRARHGAPREGREAAGEAPAPIRRCRTPSRRYSRSASRDYAHKLAMYSRWNAVQTCVGAQAMDASAIVRRADDPRDDRGRALGRRPRQRRVTLAATGYAPPCSATGMRRARAAWGGPTIRWPSPMRRRASRRRGPARGRRLDHAQRALRQHQLADHHDRREGGGDGAERTIIAGRIAYCRASIGCGLCFANPAVASPDRGKDERRRRLAGRCEIRP